MLRFLLLVIISLVSFTASADIYRWEDGNGVVHFTDIPTTNKGKHDKVLAGKNVPKKIKKTKPGHNLHLGKIKSTLYAARTYAIECQSHASVYHKKDESCYKAKRLMSSISYELYQVENYQNTHDIDELPYQETSDFKDIMRYKKIVKDSLYGASLLF